MISDSNLSIDCLPMPALVIDQEGSVLFCNEKASSLLGVELVNKNLNDIIDFTKTDLVDCNTFQEASELIKSRHQDLNVVSLQDLQSPISSMDIHFSFCKQGGDPYVLLVLQDVTERIKLIEAFEYKQNLLDNIVTTSTDALIVFDDHGCIELFSPAAESMFGKTSIEMIIEDIFSLFTQKSNEKVKLIIDQLKASDSESELLVFEDLDLVNAAGECVPASVTFSTSQKDSDSLFFMVASDKSLFQHFVNSVDDAYIKTDEHGKIIDINNKTEALFNYDRQDFLSSHISFLGIKNSVTSAVLENISSLERCEHEGEYIASNQDGDELTLNLTVWPQQVNNIRLNNLIIRDISQKKIAERQLITSAFTDTLTGLANRANFNNALAEQMDSALSSGNPFALLALDLDKFKDVNDTLGHDYGDQLLKASASRLTACVRDLDLVSRMGGDEFTIIIREFESIETVTKIAERILRTFRKEFLIKDKKVLISSSIGVACYPADASNAEKLYKAADMAMYAAKRAGKDAFRAFTVEMQQEYERVKLIERALLTAVENEEFTLHFQPKVDFSEKRIVGFEALLRWQNTVLGNVSPGEFIPIAEESGCIVDITQWVLSSAIQAMKRWRTEFPEVFDKSLTISVNVSADHFQNDVCNDVRQVLDREQFDPKLLELEITEGVLLEHTEEVVDVLKNLRELGVKISMDDFGTGYSSLQYLKHFTLNTIKIDRSFVHDIHTNEHNILIIESILSIAKRLNLKVVTEGVESASEIDDLVGLGCNIFQGFFYSKPLPEQCVIDFMTTWDAHIESLEKAHIKGSRSN